MLRRALYTLNQIIKEISGARLPAGIQLAAQVRSKLFSSLDLMLKNLSDGKRDAHVPDGEISTVFYPSPIVSQSYQHSRPSAR